jgi:hypothetical protein
VTNVTFANFRSKASLYGLNINQYWQNTFEPDTGSVTLSNLVFRNFSGKTLAFIRASWFVKYHPGSVANGVQRPPLYLIANDLTYASNVTVEDFTIWTEFGSSVVNKVNNVFGRGDDSYGPSNGLVSLAAGEQPHTYTSTYTITASPTGWVAPDLPTWAVPSTGYGSKWVLNRWTADAKGVCSCVADSGLHS